MLLANALLDEFVPSLFPAPGPQCRPSELAGVPLAQLGATERLVVDIGHDQDASTGDRYAAHHDASQKLDALNFFADGTGIFATPDGSWLYLELGRDPGWTGALARRFANRDIGLNF